MNGLIQHLATSGIDLSEDNVLGASSNNDTSMVAICTVMAHGLIAGALVCLR